jgi:hypothetical protein
MLLLGMPSVLCVATVRPSSTAELFPGTNNVFSRAVLHGTNVAVRFLGNTSSVGDCEEKCVRGSPTCKSFTWHSTLFPDDAWASGCYGSTNNAWVPHAQPLVTTGTVGWMPEPNPSPPPPLPPPKCLADSDCSYNGVCDNATGSCVCDRAWTGRKCGSLHLLRSPRGVGYHAVVTHADGNKTASWGGSVIHGDDGLYHMYAAEIAGQCGMNVWLSNSRVIHASSPDPTTTPFEKVGVVAHVFAHEPIAQRAPSGEYVVWFTAVFLPNPLPVNGGQTYVQFHMQCLPSSGISVFLSFESKLCCRCSISTCVGTVPIS